MDEFLAKRELKRYSFLILIGLLIFLSYLILRPYLISLISAFILAFLARPAYVFLEKKIGKTGAGFACIVLMIVVVILPFALVVFGTINEAAHYIEGGSLREFAESLSSMSLINYLGLENVDFDSLVKQGLSFFISHLTPIISRFASFLISLFILFLGFYTFLLNWDFLSNELKNYLPFKDKKKVGDELANATRSIVYGALLIGLIEFIIAAAGFYLIGVDSYLLLSSLIFFSAFIPGIGPGAIWVPTAIYYLLFGNYFSAVGVIILGLIISFGVDTFFRAKITEKNTSISSLVMLLGIFGGVAVFGLFGFIVGPLILDYTIKLAKEIVNE